MEEYLQCMRTLRSQMNDVEDQATKISVEEQMLITTIQTTERDLQSAKSETKQLKEDIEHMLQAKGQTCSQILEKQRKNASLESDSYSLTHTLELIQQERVSLSAKLIEKSTYYTKVAEDINSKLEQQQEWVRSHKLVGELGEQGLVKSKIGELTSETEGNCNHLDNLGTEAGKIIMDKLDSAKAKFNQIAQQKSKLVMENSKLKQSVQQAKCRENDYKPELRAMDTKALEDELQALLSDKAGEIEFLHSLQDQIQNLKGISHVIKCVCGLEYQVEVNPYI